MVSHRTSVYFLKPFYRKTECFLKLKRYMHYDKDTSNYALIEEEKEYVFNVLKWLLAIIKIKIVLSSYNLVHWLSFYLKRFLYYCIFLLWFATWLVNVLETFGEIQDYYFLGLLEDSCAWMKNTNNSKI